MTPFGRTKISCKDCGNPVFVTAVAQRFDVARNLSAPERCEKCRRRNRDEINNSGQSYWEPKVETDDQKRCWGKYGLGRLVRDRPDPVTETYEGLPVELPLLAASDPSDARIPDRWRELAQKFSKIAPIAEELVQKLKDPNGPRVFVLVGPTGTGKSTWVPYRLLRSHVGEHGRIVVTQPRTITLRADKGTKGPPGVPGYIASALMGIQGNWIGAGQELGIQYKGVYDQKDNYTKLLFVTDGTLINWLRSGEISQFDLVMIDEAHERSENMELIFALLKHRMSLYPRMKLLIASATIDIDSFVNYFGGGSLGQVAVVPEDTSQIEAATTLKTIHDRFDAADLVPEVGRLVGKEPRARLELIPSAVAELVRRIVTDESFTKLSYPQGDILVFVPRIDDARQVVAAVQSLGLAIATYECHAQLARKDIVKYDASDKAAARAMAEGKPSTPQRVIVATNYAETSVTMSNLRYVIDTGLIVQQSWDPETCSVSFGTLWHSQAGCKQRRGRVGRVQDGECFRLYTKDEHDSMPEDTVAEISRVSLDSFLLKAKATGIDDLESFDWLGKTDDDTEFARARATFANKTVVDADGDLTHRGVEFAGLQVDSVDSAACMSESETFACTLEMATFLAFMQSSTRPFLRGEQGALAFARWRSGCRDDLELYLRLFHHWRAKGTNKKSRGEWFERNGVDPEFLEAAEESCQGLVEKFSRKTHDSVTWRDLDLDRLGRVRMVVARGMPEWVYLRDSDTGEFAPVDPDRCPCPTPVRIDSNSACLAVDGLEAIVSIGRTRIGERIYARHVVRLDPRWVTHLRASPVAAARTLRNSRSEFARGVSSSVVTKVPPHPRSPLYKTGDTVRLRTIRTVVEEGLADGERSKKYLCEAKKHDPFIAEFDVDVFSTPGKRFEVAVTSKSKHLLRVSQKPVIERLIQDSTVVPATIAKLGLDKEGSPFGIFVELPDHGLDALLHISQMAWSERDRFLKDPDLGAPLEVVVHSFDNNRLGVQTKAVAEGRRTALRVGETHHAIVTDWAKKKETGALAGVRLEILPGRGGFVPAHMLGNLLNAPDVNLPIGSTLRVELVKVPSDPADDVGARLPARTFRRSERTRATVAHIPPATGDRGPAIAILDLAPGVKGILHHKNAEWGLLNSLYDGKALEVEVMESRQGKHGDTEYEVQTIPVADARGIQLQVGNVHSARVLEQCYSSQGDRAGRPSGLRMEILPGRNGFLPMRALGYHSQKRFDSLYAGATLDVELRAFPAGRDIELCLPTPSFYIGQSVNATVVHLGEDTRGWGPPWAKVELAPSVTGFLHNKQAPRDYLKSLYVGASIRVTLLAENGVSRFGDRQFKVSAG